jgi:hypothetical protein
MNTRQRCIAILILAMSLAISSCGQDQVSGPATAPVSTSKPILPTATPPNTPIPPTPTIAAIPGSNEPVVIGDFKLNISTVVLSDKGFNGMVPYPMAADETVLAIEVILISGELADLSHLDVWVTDEQGNRKDSGTTLSMDSKNQVVWLFPVAKSAHSFSLHFPSGEVIDLSPLLP